MEAGSEALSRRVSKLGRLWPPRASRAEKSRSWVMRALPSRRANSRILLSVAFTGRRSETRTASHPASRSATTVIGAMFMSARIGTSGIRVGQPVGTM